MNANSCMSISGVVEFVCPNASSECEGIVWVGKSRVASVGTGDRRDNLLLV
jgi:hypothetical protein